MRFLVIPTALKNPVKIMECDVDNCLEAYQSGVQGYIESYPARFQNPAVMLYVNEDGRLRQMPINEHLRKLGFVIVGPAVITCVDEAREDDVGLLPTQNETNWQSLLQK